MEGHWFLREKRLWSNSDVVDDDDEEEKDDRHQQQYYSDDDQMRACMWSSVALVWVE